MNAYTQAEEIDIFKKTQYDVLLVIDIYCLSLYYKQDN